MCRTTCARRTPLILPRVSSPLLFVRGTCVFSDAARKLRSNVVPVQADARPYCFRMETFRQLRLITYEIAAYRSVEEPPCFNRLGLQPRIVAALSPTCVMACRAVRSCECGAAIPLAPLCGAVSRACALVSARGIRRLVCRRMYRAYAPWPARAPPGTE